MAKYLNMSCFQGLRKPFQPNPQGLIDNILRKGTPERVYNIELFQDPEISDAIAERFDLTADIELADPCHEQKKYIAVQRFCGFDYVRVGLTGLEVELNWENITDTATLERSQGRNYINEQRGPITNWEEFEKYPWPDPHAPDATRQLQWYQENLPEDMCIIGSGGFAHFGEWLTWLMGYEMLCYSLYDQRELVVAIMDKLQEFFRVAVQRLLEFDRVKIIWGSDDLGFKTGLLISPRDTREFILPGHKLMAQMAHEADRPYLLHSCGNLADIIYDLVDEVKIDAKHSFEDTIEDVRQVKHTYGQKIALLGGLMSIFSAGQMSRPFAIAYARHWTSVRKVVDTVWARAIA